MEGGNLRQTGREFRDLVAVEATAGASIEGVTSSFFRRTHWGIQFRSSVAATGSTAAVETRGVDARKPFNGGPSPSTCATDDLEDP